jgi:hypothetical protein
MEPGPRASAIGTRELPIVATIVRGYREAVQHLVVYAVQATMWACSVGALGYALDIAAIRLARAHRMAGPLAAAAPYAPALVEIVILLLGNTTIAMTAYRAAIKEEQPHWLRAMRLGGRELRFLGLTLLFYMAEYVAIFLLVLLVVGVSHVTGAGPVVRRALETTSYAVVLQLCFVLLGNLLVSATVAPIFGLALPLAAIDGPSGLLRRAARMSHGYRVRLGVISFLAMLPVVVAPYMPFLVWTPDADTTAYYVR